MPSRPPWQKYAVLLASLILAILLIGYDWKGIIDDAYIFLRYAHNIASGVGYVFNAGEYVEGATSTTWTLLLAGLAWLGVPLVTAVRVLSLATLLGTLAMTWQKLNEEHLPAAAALFGLALLAADHNFSQAIMMGLETGLYCLLLIWFGMLASQPQLEARRVYWLGLCGVLLFLTRPESLLLLAMVGAGLVLRNKGRLTWTTLAFWAAGILVVTQWRLAVFGDFIPNSARDKSVVEFIIQQPDILWPRVQAGLGHIVKWLGWSWPLAGLGAAGWVFRLRQDRWAGTVWGAILLATGITVLYNSGDWMPFFRLLAPAAVVLAVLGGSALRALSGWLQGKWKQGLSLTLVSLTVLVYGFAWSSLPERGFLVLERWDKEVCYVRAGQALRPVLPIGTVLSPEALGALGFELIEFRFFDSFGLVEPFIARNGRIPVAAYSLGKHHYAYTMQQAPDLFFFHSQVNNHIPLLNRFGYSDQYATYNLVADDCSLLVGIKKTGLPILLPAFQAAFSTELVETHDLVEVAGNWPLGIR